MRAVYIIPYNLLSPLPHYDLFMLARSTLSPVSQARPKCDKNIKKANSRVQRSWMLQTQGCKSAKVVGAANSRVHGQMNFLALNKQMWGSLTLAPNYVYCCQSSFIAQKLHYILAYHDYYGVYSVHYFGRNRDSASTKLSYVERSSQFITSAVEKMAIHVLDLSFQNFCNWSLVCHTGGYSTPYELIHRDRLLVEVQMQFSLSNFLIIMWSDASTIT